MFCNWNVKIDGTWTNLSSLKWDDLQKIRAVMRSVISFLLEDLIIFWYLVCLYTHSKVFLFLIQLYRCILWLALSGGKMAEKYVQLKSWLLYLFYSCVMCSFWRLAQGLGKDSCVFFFDKYYIYMELITPAFFSIDLERGFVQNKKPCVFKLFILACSRI